VNGCRNQHAQSHRHRNSQRHANANTHTATSAPPTLTRSATPTLAIPAQTGSRTPTRTLDGIDFFGWQSSGDSEGWKHTTYDLTDLAGMPEVWIAFGFESDESVTDLGVWVDDVVLRKK
jgi:hypothetical protein